jgi:hypothetical protein
MTRRGIVLGVVRVPLTMGTIRSSFPRGKKVTAPARLEMIAADGYRI